MHPLGTADLPSGEWMHRKSKSITPPVKIPISLSQTGRVLDLIVDVPEHRVYYFLLKFHHQENKESRDHLLDLLGSQDLDNFGKQVRPGLPIPIALNIFLLENGIQEKSYTKTTDPVLQSWGENTFSKAIGYCDLKPGTYKFQLDLSKERPEFSFTPVFFIIGNSKYYTVATSDTYKDRRKSCPQQ